MQLHPAHAAVRQNDADLDRLVVRTGPSRHHRFQMRAIVRVTHGPGLERIHIEGHRLPHDLNKFLGAPYRLGLEVDLRHPRMRGVQGDAQALGCLQRPIARARLIGDVLGQAVDKAPAVDVLGAIAAVEMQPFAGQRLHPAGRRAVLAGLDDPGHGDAHALAVGRMHQRQHALDILDGPFRHVRGASPHAKMVVRGIEGPGPHARRLGQASLNILRRGLILVFAVRGQDHHPAGGRALDPAGEPPPAAVAAHQPCMRDRAGGQDGPVVGMDEVDKAAPGQILRRPAQRGPRAVARGDPVLEIQFREQFVTIFEQPGHGPGLWRGFDHRWAVKMLEVGWLRMLDNLPERGKRSI